MPVLDDLPLDFPLRKGGVKPAPDITIQPGAVELNVDRRQLQPGEPGAVHGHANVCRLPGGQLHRLRLRLRGLEHAAQHLALLVAEQRADRVGRLPEPPVHHPDDLGEVGVDEHGPQHLVVVTGRAVLVLARHTLGAVDLGGAEVFDPIQGDQVTAL